MKYYLELAEINNYFMNSHSENNYFFLHIGLKLYTHGSSIYSRRKFRVQQLAGEPVENVIRHGPLVNL